MRQNFSVAKLISFNNSECLSDQTTVYSANITNNEKGKKEINSGEILYKDTSDVVRILKRYNPISNIITSTSGVLTLNSVNNISIGDKVDLLFDHSLLTFSGTTAGTNTVTLGGLVFTFAGNATEETAVDALITAYNSKASPQKKEIEYSFLKVATTKVLVISKTLNTETPTITGTNAANITVTNLNGIRGDSQSLGILGTVTDVDTTNLTVNYTAEAGYASLNLYSTTVQITTPNQEVKSVLGFLTQDYDLTNYDTKVIPYLTGSKGVWKKRLAYFDQDLVQDFPRINFMD